MCSRAAAHKWWGWPSLCSFPVLSGCSVAAPSQKSHKRPITTPWATSTCEPHVVYPCHRDLQASRSCEVANRLLLAWKNEGKADNISPWWECKHLEETVRHGFYGFLFSFVLWHPVKKWAAHVEGKEACSKGAYSGSLRSPWPSGKVIDTHLQDRRSLWKWFPSLHMECRLKSLEKRGAFNVPREMGSNSEFGSWLEKLRQGL